MSKNKISQDFVTQLHYVLMYNDLHYKLGLLDISPWEKTNRYITYEPGKRVFYENMSGDEELNVNIVCDKSIDTREHGKLYLYLCILYWIVTTIVLYVMYKKRSSIISYTRLYKKNIGRFFSSTKKQLYNVL